MPYSSSDTVEVIKMEQITTSIDNNNALELGHHPARNSTPYLFKNARHLQNSLELYPNYSGQNNFICNKSNLNTGNNTMGTPIPLNTGDEESCEDSQIEEEGMKCVSLEFDTYEDEDCVEMEYFDETEEDCDGFVFENSISTRETVNKISTPFWFGNEDKEQLKSIINSYTKTLRLDEERKKCIRAPVPFVGRVKRTVVPNETGFTTFDAVEVYQRGIVAPGTTMPFKKEVCLLTTWSSEEGLPISCLQIEDKEFLANRDQNEPEFSYLTCLPVYGSSCDYNYFVSNQKQDVTYSPLSPRLCSQFWYSDYIPETWKRQGTEIAGED